MSRMVVLAIGASIPHRCGFAGRAASLLARLSGGLRARSSKSATLRCLPAEVAALVLCRLRRIIRSRTSVGRETTRNISALVVDLLRAEDRVLQPELVQRRGEIEIVLGDPVGPPARSSRITRWSTPYTRIEDVDVNPSSREAPHYRSG